MAFVDVCASSSCIAPSATKCTFYYSYERRLDLQFVKCVIMKPDRQGGILTILSRFDELEIDCVQGYIFANKEGLVSWRSVLTCEYLCV